MDGAREWEFPVCCRTQARKPRLGCSQTAFSLDVGLLDGRGQFDVVPWRAVLFFASIQFALALLLRRERFGPEDFAHLACWLSGGVILYGGSHDAERCPERA